MRRTISSSSAHRRVADDELHGEAVDLGLGQRVDALALDRVLGRQHEERARHRVALAGDRGVALGHHLEQRRLHLGRRAVDLVGQDEVGEDRAEAGGEAAPWRSSTWPPTTSRRHEVRRELDAAEAGRRRRGRRSRASASWPGRARPRAARGRGRAARRARGRAGGPGRRRRAAARRGRPPCARAGSRPPTGTRRRLGAGAVVVAVHRVGVLLRSGWVRGRRRAMARDPRDGDGEADADVAGDRAEDRGGDADQAAAQVEEAAAGVAGVDRGVDLDHRDALVVGAADGADDAGGDGVLEAEGAADGEDLVALAQAAVGLVGQLGAAADRRPRGFRIARSWRSSAVTIVAGTRRSSGVIRVTVVSRRAMTWWLVTTRPDGLDDHAAALAAGVGLDLRRRSGRRRATDVGDAAVRGRLGGGW